MRPPHPLLHIKSLQKNDFNKVIKRFNFNPNRLELKTNYEIIKSNQNGYNIITYQFKIKDIVCNLDFIKTNSLESKIKNSNKPTIKILKSNDIRVNHIGFKIINNNNLFIEDRTYVHILRKIIYLIKKNINNCSNTDIFCIGKNVGYVDFNIYLNEFKPIFNDDYITINGTNNEYRCDAVYYINKKNIKRKYLIYSKIKYFINNLLNKYLTQI